MPFFIRKAISVGPLRFNLSKSGIGVSVGIPGFRIGSGAKGNYVHAGRHGLYYRKGIPGDPVPSATVFRDALGHRASDPPDVLTERPATLSTTATLREFESGSALSMVDSTSGDILRDLNAKRSQKSTWPLALGFTLVLVPTIGFMNAGLWVTMLVAMVGIGMTFWRYGRDELDKYVVSMYELEEDLEKAFAELCATFDELSRPRSAWHVASEREISNPKSSSGASSGIERYPTTPHLGSGPKHMKTNISVPKLSVGKQELDFLPDRVIVFAPEGYGSIRYSDLSIEIEEEQFVESKGLPEGARVVGSVWKYVNKSGGPDRRFKDNQEFPIALYDRVHLKSSTGLNEVIQITRPGLAKRLQDLLRKLGS